MTAPLGRQAEITLEGHTEDNSASVHAIVCCPALDAIDEVAADIGCSRGALIDAFGHLLARPDIREALLATEPMVVAAKWARHLSAERRKRGNR